MSALFKMVNVPQKKKVINKQINTMNTDVVMLAPIFPGYLVSFLSPLSLTSDSNFPRKWTNKINTMSTNGVMLGRNRRGYLVPFLGLLSFTSDSFVPPPLNYQYYCTVLYYHTKHLLSVACQVRWCSSTAICSGLQRQHLSCQFIGILTSPRMA